MSPMVMERKAPRHSLAFAGRSTAHDECPLCAMCGYEPNEETIEAIRESRDNNNLKRQNLSEFLAELYA